MTVSQPFDQRDGFIWYNGQLVPWRETKVHVLNHGLHYGSSVFEGIRIYEGNIFKMQEHNERLKKSAQLLGFEIPYTVEELNDACTLITKTQKVENGYIRPVAWLGSEKMKIYAGGNSVHL